jgi:hypothetical protein
MAFPLASINQPLGGCELRHGHDGRVHSRHSLLTITSIDEIQFYHDAVIAHKQIAAKRLR